jgi:hypothetical protein
MDAGAGGFIAIEKWNAGGGGYEVHSRVLTGTNPITLSSITLGASTTGCKVGLVGAYLSSLPLGSAPPSAIASPATGALRYWSFDDQTSPALDSSGNGGNMTFNATPSWVSDPITPACWISTGNGVAGAPIQLTAYHRGTVTNYTWSITSQPAPEAGVLSSSTSATPILTGVTAGTLGL